MANLNDAELVMNRWKEYIERLYNAEDKPCSLNIELATDKDDIGPYERRSSHSDKRTEEQ